MELTSVQFAQIARMIGRAARDLGDNVTNVTYRSPPREPGRSRTIRGNSADREWTVSVTIRARNAHAVVADMIEGYCVASRRAHDGHRLAGLSDGLWAAVDDYLLNLLSEWEKNPR
jgi:hypothetical protein